MDPARIAARLVPAACALLMASSAHAAPNAGSGPVKGIAAAFGNTVRAIYPDGRYQRIWLHPDGTWDAIGKRGKPSSGHWTQKGEKVCLKQSKPFPFPFSYCTDFPPDGALGVVWAGKDMKGQPIQLTVVEGIDRP